MIIKYISISEYGTRISRINKYNLYQMYYSPNLKPFDKALSHVVICHSLVHLAVPSNSSGYDILLTK